MNILLVCSAGMSTSMMVEKMKAAATEKGLEASIWAVGDSQAHENIDKADVILLGPQVRFLLSKMQTMAEGKPVMVMDMMAYGTMNGTKILDDALKLLEK